MSGKDDDEDEEELATTTGTGGSSWGAGYHAREREAAAGFESAGFRGVPGIPHGGAQYVSPDDTGGSMDLCWCGLPFDHDWPGKALGARHPRKDLPMIQPDTNAPARIERRALRAYHEDLADLIMTAVNEYGVKYRVTAHSVLLFPPDGSAPYAVNARNSDRQRKSAQQWFVRHCIPPEELDKPVRKSRKPRTVDADAIKELAETVNSEEHLPKLEEPPLEEPPAEEPKAEPEPPTEEPAEEPVASEEWVPYRVGKNKADKHDHEFIVTNGVDVKCTIDGWVGKPAGVGGHTRTRHRPTEDMWGPEARAKSNETIRNTKVKEGVAEAIELLQNAIGVSSHKADSDALREENGQLKARVTELEAQLAELEAKWALFRESFAALEQ